MPPRSPEFPTNSERKPDQQSEDAPSRGLTDEEYKEVKSRKLRNQQEAALINLSHRFLDEGKNREAFELLKRTTSPNVAVLTGLIAVWISNNIDPGEQALALFTEKLNDDYSFGQLMQVYLYVKNPKRYFIPSWVSEKIETKMYAVNPHWDGSLDISSRSQMDEKLRFTDPAKISDPELCLDLAASGKGNPQSYMDRYLELGGNDKDERFLKVKLNRILLGNISEKSKTESIRLMHELAEQIGTEDFRKWARTNSKKSTLDEHRIPRSFALTVLAVYVSLGPENLNEEDWTYIAERSIELNEAVLQKICLEFLKKSPRNQKTQEMFEKLTKLVKGNERDVREKTAASLQNPLYNDFGTRAPINKMAAMMVGIWAKDALES